MHTIKGIIALTGLVVLTGACSPATQTPNKPTAATPAGVANASPANTAPAVSAPAEGLLTDSSGDLAAGKEVYAMNCMLCHKDSGKGGKVTVEGKSYDADDLTSDKMKKHTDDKLFSHITNGVPDEGMPAFKGKLTDEEIKLVVKYLRQLQGA